MSDPGPVRCNDDNGIDDGGGIICASVSRLGAWFNASAALVRTRCALLRLGNTGGVSSLPWRSSSVSVVEPSSSSSSGGGELCDEDEIPGESQPRRYDVMEESW